MWSACPAFAAGIYRFDSYIRQEYLNPSYLLVATGEIIQDLVRIQIGYRGARYLKSD